MDSFDYKEPACFCDMDFYKDKPEQIVPKGRIKVSEMISQIDRLYAREDMSAVGRVLEEYSLQAKMLNDADGELTVVNEMMGHYRMSGDIEKGLASVDRCMELLKILQPKDSVGVGTVVLNAATALRSFGKTDRAKELYATASRIYGSTMAKDDARFAGLFNNMASVYEQTGEYDRAEVYYNMALEVLSNEKNVSDSRNILDMAVTYINLAQLYSEKESESEKISEYVERSMECFDNENVQRDYYYAHTARKCAGAFGYLGYFLYQISLDERADEFYRERN